MSYWPEILLIAGAASIVVLGVWAWLISRMADRDEIQEELHEAGEDGPHDVAKQEEEY